eukprot:PhM_4_TR15612/c0_g1_i1/m.81785
MDNQKLWDRFLGELHNMHVDFDVVRYTDEKSRGQLLEHMNFGPIERAIVSSLWAQQQTASSQPRQPSAAASPSSVASPATSVPRAHSTAFNATASPAMRGASPSTRPVQEVCEIARSALGRGDATTALSLTTEMLDRDPLALVYLLHEFMPHVPPEQLGQLLGFDMHATQQQGTLSSSAMAKPLGAGSPNSALPATINGIPVRVGEVVTAQSLAAQFGVGFVATCNEVGMVFPHCVQPGDAIRIVPAGNSQHSPMR